ncbi:MAG: hypothetical protein Q7S48_00955 [bacterium]|nr:hypothetical protein [bacterium]
MFDTPPSNLPTGKEPEDIFDKVEPAPSPGFQPSSPSGRGEGEGTTSPAEVKAPLVASRKIIVIGGVILGILVIVGVGYAAFRFVRRTSNPVSPVVSEPVESPAVEETPMPQIPELPSPILVPEEPVTQTEPVEPVAPVDSDSDGLSDEEEDAAGTMRDNPDSDNDSLLDGEEVKTYQTDPMNADTDGDTFLDGAEVKNGYNPKGPGKLFTVPSQ